MSEWGEWGEWGEPRLQEQRKTSGKTIRHVLTRNGDDPENRPEVLPASTGGEAAADAPWPDFLTTRQRLRGAYLGRIER